MIRQLVLAVSLVSLVLLEFLFFKYLTGKFGRKKERTAPLAKDRSDLESSKLFQDIQRRKEESAQLGASIDELEKQLGIKPVLLPDFNCLDLLNRINDDEELKARVNLLRQNGIRMRIGYSNYIGDDGVVWLSSKSSLEELRAFLLQ